MSVRSNLHVLLALLATGIAFGQSASPTLRSVYQDHFLIGVALKTTQVDGQNPKAAEIVARQWNSCDLPATCRIWTT